MIVTLSQCEWDAAWAQGLRRQELREKRGKSQDLQTGTRRGGDEKQRNGVGTVAEYALAKHFGKDILQDWVRTKSFSYEHWKIKADVGKALQVRATDTPHYGLPLQTWEHYPDCPFILATVDIPSRVVTFRGWCWESEGKKSDFWKTRPIVPRPAWFVPQYALRSMSTLPDEAIWL